MEDKVSAARNALDSIDKAAAGPAGVACTGTAGGGDCAQATTPRGAVGGRYDPHDRAALLARLQTYRPGTWFGKPPELAPPACARLGWRNVGLDRLSCDFCRGKVSCVLPPGAASAPGGSPARAAAARFVALLTENHDAACPWRRAGAPAHLLTFAPAPAACLAAGFDARAAGLRRLMRLPDISRGAVRRLAAWAYGASASGVAAFAALVGVSLEQLERLAQEGGSGGDGASAAAVPFAGAARLLALSGWEAVDLKPGSQSSGAGGCAARDAPAPAAAISPARAALRCSLCAGGCGLWGLLAGGAAPPAKRTRAARLVSAGREDLLALGQGQAEAARTAAEAAPSGGDASEDWTSWVAREEARAEGQAAASGVARSLHQTIAGGSAGDGQAAGDGAGPFGAAAAAPAFGGGAGGGGGGGPFGRASSSEPAFGLSALEAEVRKRRRSGSAGASGGGGGGTGAAAPQDSIDDAAKPPVRVREQPRAGHDQGREEGAMVLDLLGLHRPWCPWVSPPEEEKGTGSGGSVATAAAGAGQGAECGWQACLRALWEVRGDSSGEGDGGGGARAAAGGAAVAGLEGDLAPVDARQVEEDVRRSRAAMAAKMRAALDALGGA
jgi:hypothetical protein